MKKIALCIAALCVAMVGYALGNVQEGLTIKSKILKQKMKYSVYLPEGYETSTRQYPVLYLLHGLNCSYSCWIQQGDVRRIADEAIASGQAPEMIIVMPDAMNTWYMNDYQGKFRYEDYFIQELIPFIDRQYRTRATKKYRGISGLSMGGHGALLYALKYPALFSRCFAMSPGVYTHEYVQKFNLKEVQYRNFDVLYGWDSIPGPQRINPHYLQNSTLALVEHLNKDQAGAVQFFVDCGDDDYLIEGNLALIKAMRTQKMKLEFRMRDGAHVWKYWRDALPSAMQFIGESFMSNR